MKILKSIFMVSLLMTVGLYAFADQHDVELDFHRQRDPKEDLGVNRAPMRIAIEVIYDSDSRTIEVTGDDSVEAEVFLYTTNGSIEGYSSTLNSTFTLSHSGTYLIQIQSESWYAEGTVIVNI